MLTPLDFPCGYVRVDDRRVIVDANHEAARLLGRPRSELLNQKLRAILPAPTRLFFQTHVYPALSQNERVEELYVSLLSNSGAPLHVLMTAQRVVGPKPTYLFAFLPMNRRILVEQDVISSREAAERAAEAEQVALTQVREIQSQLQLQDRLASLGTLAAGVAHEINNPLTFVLGNLDVLDEMIRTESVPGKQLLAVVRETRGGVDRIRGIVRSLKGLSRFDEGPRGPVDLGLVVEAATKLCAHQLRTRVQVTLDVASPAPVVAADEGRLVQVMVNLLVNAAQSMPERPVAENRITVSARTHDTMALIDVEDNGCGIPEDVQKRVFDPFFTTKPVGVGTGLGLSVSQGIVAAFGGSMQVTSTVGAGTRFRVVLPLAAPSGAQAGSAPVPPEEAAAAPSIPATERSAAAPSERTRRLLVVDDEQSVLRTLKRILKGYEVTATTDGREAVARIAAGETFDVILCDLAMPAMSGIAVYEAVRAHSPALARRIVFMTGGTAGEHVERFLDEVDNDHIEKPFDVDELRQLCRRTSEGRGERGPVRAR